MTTNRIGGSAAALVVLYGVPTVVALAEYAAPYDVAVALAVVPAAWIAARLLWPDLGNAGLAYVGSAAVIAAAVAAIGLIAAFALIFLINLCGSDDWTAAITALVVSVIVYGIGGLWAFQKPRRLLWGWPLVLVAALAVAVAVTAAFPSGHGSCD